MARDFNLTWLYNELTSSLPSSTIIQNFKNIYMYNHVKLDKVHLHLFKYDPKLKRIVYFIFYMAWPYSGADM